MSTPVFVGQRVLFRLSKGHIDEIRARREYDPNNHRGNPLSEGQQYPADVVAHFGGSTVNLRVILDGYGDHWACSVSQGDGPGQWQRTAF